MTDSSEPSPDLKSALPQENTESTSTAEPASKSSWLALLVQPLLIGLVYLAFWQIAPKIKNDSITAIIISTMIALALSIWLPAKLGYNLRSSMSGVLASILLSAIVIVPVQLMIVTGHRISPPWTLLRYLPGVAFLALIWLAASFGVLLSKIVRGANMIPPVAAVLALVDIWTVLLGGPVQKIMQSSNPTARAVTQVMNVPLPTPPQNKTATPINGTVGFADFVFIAFFVAAICRFVPGQKTYSRTLYGFIGILCVYMLVVLFRESNLPALAPMAVIMLVIHWRHFHYDRSELFALLYAGLFIVLIAAGFWYFGRSREPVPEGKGEMGMMLEGTSGKRSVVKTLTRSLECRQSV